MRIIHTSDWHLGSSWRGHDRTDELFAQVEQVCDLVKAHDADVLLVAGDVFERVGRDRLHQVTKRLAVTLKPLVDAGCHVVLVPGNHDLREHFGVMKTFLELESGRAERVHVAQSYEAFDIEGVQFLLVPYPERELLERYGAHKAAQAVGREDRNRFLSNDLIDFMREVEAQIDPARPAVLATHLQIYGVKYGSEREATYNDDLCLASNRLPPNVAYIALGHIHQCQQITHSVPTWYSGSFDCMDMGERDDDKFVLLVEINGCAEATVEKLPLTVTKFADIQVKSRDLASYAAAYPDRAKTYARLTIECAKDDDLLALRRQARELFPRLGSVPELTGDIFPATVTSPFSNPDDYQTTVAEFLAERFAGDADLPALQKRAQELFQEAHHALTKN